jgi:5-methylcytosine-specific restriction endonuclease McrA
MRGAGIFFCPMQIPLFKTCTKCNQTKFVTQFFRDASLPDGTRYICKECDKKRKNEWRANNQEHDREYFKQYRDNNKESLARNNHKWYESHKEQIKIKKAVYEANNKEKMSQVRRDWAKKHPELGRKLAKDRRARLKGATGVITPQEWQALLKEHDHKCYYCGTTERITQDHWIPLSRGGSHTIDNIVPACHSCNSRKYNMTGDEYLAKLKDRNR